MTKPSARSIHNMNNGYIVTHVDRSTIDTSISIYDYNSTEYKLITPTLYKQKAMQISNDIKQASDYKYSATLWKRFHQVMDKIILDCTTEEGARFNAYGSGNLHLYRAANDIGRNPKCVKAFYNTIMYAVMSA